MKKIDNYEFQLDFYVYEEKEDYLTDTASGDLYELVGYYDGEQLEVYKQPSTTKTDSVPRSLNNAEYRMFNEFLASEIISCLEERKRQAEIDRAIDNCITPSVLHKM